MIKLKLLSVVAILSSAIATPALAQAIIQVHSASMSARAQTRTNENGARPQSYGNGREVTAPAWSAACVTDHGPSECGQPMWIYGNSGGVPERYIDAF
jgi:hypothetical protein